MSYRTAQALLFALILITFSSSDLFCQYSDNSTERNTTNVYYQALHGYLFQLEKQPDSIYLEEDYKITNDILNQVGTTKIIVVKSHELRRLLKKKSITLYRIFPLTFKENTFQVSLIPFSVSYQRSRKNITFMHPGGSSVFFKYDDGHLQFTEVKNYAL